jgi:glycosyltransferase involved in cell wall biosynthesis
MRIAMIGLRGVPACHGGVERAVEELGADLAARGHEVIVYCRAPYYTERPEYYRGMRLIYLPTSKRRGLESFVHSALASIAALRLRPDVVHYHAIGPGLFSPITRLFSRATVVQTIHGLDDERGKWGSGARKLLKVGRYFSEHVPHVVLAVSGDLTRIYQGRRRGATEHVSNGVRTPTPVPDDRTTLKLPLDLTADGYLLHVGRLVPEKGADLMLEAYSRLETDLPLIIVGASSHTDSFASNLREQAAKDPRVVMAGWMDGERLSKLYAGARAFVLPSKLEGMPLVILEAGAHGTPIVASDIPPHLEVLGGSSPGRRLFAHGDPQALLEALQACLEAPVDLERKNAAELRDEVLATYSWPAIATQIEESYIRAASRRLRRTHLRGRKAALAAATVPPQPAPPFASASPDDFSEQSVAPELPRPSRDGGDPAFLARGDGRRRHVERHPAAAAAGDPRGQTGRVDSMTTSDDGSRRS